MTKHKNFLAKYIFSTDHKIIAIQYLITGLFWLGFGGLMAYMIRWQLAHPWQPVPLLGKLFLQSTGGAVMPEVYIKLFTMHGGIMVFFAVTPIILGALGNFSIPLDIGARDMAFPRVNMLSYWFLFLGSVLVLISFFVPGGTSGSGWTLYTPLSSSLKATPGLGQDLFILGLTLDAVSILMGGINYIVTILKLRAKGMSLGRMPLTSWGLFFSAVLNTIWLPLAAIALFMILADRRLGTAFFTAGPLAPREGGQVLLFQHLFWGFGHPEVYILILPVWGLVGDTLSIFSRKPAFGYKATVLSMFTITVLSGIVWGHHMFTSGMNPLVGRAFMLLTITISVPTAIFFFNWLATLWRGSIRFTLPMLYTLAVIFVFSIGGLTGLFFALQTFDIYVHDTYFVVGHFHFTLAASVLFGVYAYISFWFPKMFGRMMNPVLGRVHFWPSFFLINILFAVMMTAGLHGHMRRIADATAYTFLKPVQPLNEFMGVVALLLVITQAVFFINFIFSLFWGKKAPKNPWDAAGVAWTADSPPCEHNFAQEPVVYCGPHEHGLENPDGSDFCAQTNPQAGLLTEKASGKKQPEITADFSQWFSVTKLGMWVFLISEIMLFGGFVGSYLVLRLGSASWPNPAAVLNNVLLGINTFVLLCSSLTFAMAVSAAKSKDAALTRKLLLATIGFGSLFLIIKIADYFHMWENGFTVSSSLFGSLYYFLTGFHGLHVLSGIILIAYLWAACGKAGFLEKHWERVEASGLYWHFIDIVWVILFAVLCLI